MQEQRAALQNGSPWWCSRLPSPIPAPNLQQQSMPELGEAQVQQAGTPSTGVPGAVAMAATAQQLAVVAAEQASSSMLRRGGGMLVLLPNHWGFKAQPLESSAVVAGVAYSHFSIMQLMSHEGLLLSGGQQELSVHVAADLCSGNVAISGVWSKQQVKLTVAPQESLLLHCQPPGSVGIKFLSMSSACTHTYEALYGWTPAVVTTALGKSGMLFI